MLLTIIENYDIFISNKGERMDSKVTRDDAIRLNYECTLISMVLDSQELKDFMRDNHIEKVDLPCINNRLEKAKKFYLSQENVLRAVNDLDTDIKIYTLLKFNSGELAKDLEEIKPEVEASIKQVAAESESGESNF